jgi:hypothetical protein
MAATVARSIGKAPGHGFANHQRLQPPRASRAPRRSIVAPIVAALPGLIGRCPRQIRRTIFPAPAQRATLAEVTKQREIGQSYFIGIELESEHESPAIERSAQRDDEPWDATKRLLYHLIRGGFISSLGRQCQERGRVGAIFLPSRIGGVVCERVLASAFASTDRAYALKVAHDLRVGVRDFHPIELDLVHAPIQQIRSVRPFAGEDREIGSAHADVAGDAFHLGRTPTIKVCHRSASAVPASPPMRKPTNKAGLFAYLNRARHGSLRNGRNPTR